MFQLAASVLQGFDMPQRKFAGLTSPPHWLAAESDAIGDGRGDPLATGSGFAETSAIAGKRSMHVKSRR